MSQTTYVAFRKINFKYNGCLLQNKLLSSMQGLEPSHTLYSPPFESEYAEN